MAGPSAKDLQKALEFKNQLTEIINLIHETQDIAEIIVNLRPKILDMLDAERLSIYAVDAKNQQVYSLFKQGEEVKEIRVPRTSSSMVGFVALTGQAINIRNAYDAAELKGYHPELKFDQSWDQKTGFKTKQVLTTPVLYEKYLMGVLQLLNKVGGDAFTPEDLEAANQVARTLGSAFYNRRRMAPKRSPNKFAAIIDKNLISEKNFEDAVSYSRMNNLPVAEVLVEKYRISKDEVLKSLSAFYECPSFLYDGSQRMPEEFRERLKHEYLKKILVAPVSKDGSTVTVAMEDPSDLAKADAVRVMQLAPKVQFLVALPKDIGDYVDASFNIAAAGSGQVADILTELGAEEEEDAESAAAAKAAAEVMDDTEPAVVRLANQIIIDGYERGASDIHVEPYGKNDPCVVRFRIDGICHVYQEIPASHRAALVSRLKIMARLDISERRLPQDGKIRFKMGKGQIELRVATIPTQSGGGGDEDVVMRILAASKPMPLEDMGFSERNLRVTKELMDKPYGIFLCVGPTGSGKTTTLHSALGYINTPELKIWTAEDPVEITQRGLRQVQMRSKIGLTFANTMRSFLRADPDVIMVGEMRDKETAEIGIEASLTGHLVVSTLHTNSAPETVTRLLDMDIEPFNFADSLLGILAQRLARRVCKHCKQAFHPSEEEFAVLVKDYGEEWFAKTGLAYKPDLTLYKAVGCPECAGTGYRGRIALHELMVGTDPIKRMIQKRSPVEDIRNQAMADGMTTLMQDGIVKVLAGHTDHHQVRAVCIK
ncbi:MAG TPA: ATPase, T2SS/T4P/T4SS family [Myxococcota bacterium]|nr:ATPase, T2SS/T4P/T4SS family [Myxococcota bacterium]HRY92442.1 ATPase, T2SS/T4P/T4SS family [Myxococcota bacterium]